MARSYKKMRDSNRRNSKSTTIRALKKTSRIATHSCVFLYNFGPNWRAFRHRVWRLYELCMLGYHWRRWADTNRKGMSRSSERLGRLWLLLAEEAEALLLVFLTLAGAGVARQGDGGRERVSAAGRRRALVTGRDLWFLRGRRAAARVLNGLDPCVHLLLQTPHSSSVIFRN